MTIAVLGSANADLVIRVSRRPGAGQTVLGEDALVLPGGKGANTAVAAARLGAAVAFHGAVGDDDHGRLLLDSMRAAGVDTSPVRVLDRPTGTAFITLTPDGENSIVVSPGANGALRTRDVLLGTATVLVASLEIPLDVVEYAVAQAAATGVRVVLNLSPVAALSAQVLACLDPLVVNEHEAAALLGGEPERVDPARLLDLGPRSVVVTLGSRGAVLASADGTHAVPAPAVRAVDTTGAGDAFTGALATGLAGGQALHPAVERAVAVAALSTTRLGAQPSYPAADELAGFTAPR